MVEQDVPSSPEMVLDHRMFPSSSVRRGVQGHHRVCRNVTDRLKCLGLLAVSRAVKEWHVADTALWIACGCAGR